MPTDLPAEENCTELQIAERELDAYRSAITRSVTNEEALPFFMEMKRFLESLPKDKSRPDYAEKYIQAYQAGASTIRAPYCFFRLSDAGWSLPAALKLRCDLYCCPSVMAGVSEEVTACTDCPHCEERQTYQQLLDKFNAAKRNQIEAYERWMQALKK